MSTVFIIIGIILFAMFSFPIMLNVLNFANILGMLFSAALCLYGFFFKKINIRIKALWQKKSGKAVLSSLGIIFCCFVIIAGVLTGLMLSAANNSPDCDTTVVVLGCKVNPNGPSRMLLSRLEAAHDYLTKNKEAVCILSGGQGTDELMSEALAMKIWLTERGIDESRLYIEDKSTSTEENILFSNKIIKENNLPRKITVITNEFHQYRAKKLAEQFGCEAFSYSAKTPFYLFATYYVRELFAIANEFLLK